jgi:hypothetical protein
LHCAHFGLIITPPANAGKKKGKKDTDFTEKKGPIESRSSFDDLLKQEESF